MTRLIFIHACTTVHHSIVVVVFIFPGLSWQWWRMSVGPGSLVARNLGVDDDSLWCLWLHQHPVQVVDVGHGESQGVQLAELGVGGHPGQHQLQSLEWLAQNSHPCPLPRIGSWPRQVVFIFIIFTWHCFSLAHGCSSTDDEEQESPGSEGGDWTCVQPIRGDDHRWRQLWRSHRSKQLSEEGRGTDENILLHRTESIKITCYFQF